MHTATQQPTRASRRPTIDPQRDRVRTVRQPAPLMWPSRRPTRAAAHASQSREAALNGMALTAQCSHSRRSSLYRSSGADCDRNYTAETRESRTKHDGRAETVRTPTVDILSPCVRRNTTQSSVFLAGTHSQSSFRREFKLYFSIFPVKYQFRVSHECVSRARGQF